MGKKLFEYFVKINCKRLMKKFRVEKVIKRKGDDLYAK